MAHPSKRALDYIQRVETMQWAELRALWLAIEVGDLRSQLERRPGTVLGMMVMTGAFTLPARKLAIMHTPYRFVVWQSQDIDAALAAKNFKPALRSKYLNLCRYGLLDWTPYWQDLRIDGGGQ